MWTGGWSIVSNMQIWSNMNDILVNNFSIMHFAFAHAKFYLRETPDEYRTLRALELSHVGMWKMHTSPSLDRTMGHTHPHLGLCTTFRPVSDTPSSIPYMNLQAAPSAG